MPIRDRQDDRPAPAPATAETRRRKCSIRIAMNRSKLPKIARWITTDTMLGVVGADVFQIEALRHLVIELNRRALPLAADRVGDVEVDLRSVERAVALVERRTPCRRDRARPCSCGFGVIPGRDLAEEFGRPRARASAVIRHAEVVVDPLHQPAAAARPRRRSAPASRSSAHRPARTDGRASARTARRTLRCGAAASARGSGSAARGSCAPRWRRAGSVRGSSSAFSAISSPSDDCTRNMFCAVVRPVARTSPTAPC